MLPFGRAEWPMRLNLPNTLTMIRIFLVPLLVVVLLTPPWATAWVKSKLADVEYWSWVAALVSWLSHWREVVGVAIFLTAAATDWLDGYLARSRGQVTVLGKLLDPVADKLLVTAALLPLVRDELIPDWMAALLIGREFLVSGLRSVASAEGLVIPAGSVGKWKMGMSITAISFLIVVPHAPAGAWPAWVPAGAYLLLGTGFLWAALALSLASAGLYFWEFRHFIQARKETPAAP